MKLVDLFGSKLESAIHRLISALFALVSLSSAPTIAQYKPLDGTPEKLGTVDFRISCNAEAQRQFTRGLSLYHSYYWPEARKSFTAAAQADPTCAMPHWGHAIVLMGNAFAWPLSGNALKEGLVAVEQAKALAPKTARERDYVATAESFFKDADKIPARTRQLAYELSLEKMTRDYPDDVEAQIFHAHIMSANYDPNDKQYTNQLKAAAVLEKLFVTLPDHPGVAHYLIHSYDYPPLAERGLKAAYRYRDVAPSAPHALHMPSHTFTRLGYWQDSIASNTSVIKITRDPSSRLHSLDYMAYAYLQLGQERNAENVLADIRAMTKVEGEGLASAFALSIKRSRWSQAAQLRLQPDEIDFGWAQFPHAQAINVFARGLGAARSGAPQQARQELAKLAQLKQDMVDGKLRYWADQADIQMKVVEAWTLRAEGKADQALAMMQSAAEHEDRTEKSAVTPGPIKPARELLGEMLLESDQPALALVQFEAAMKKEPNRFRALSGAARAAESAGDLARARNYYSQMQKLWNGADPESPELSRMKAFLVRN
jgi:tetratricopeptide (TPR) repeat protein